MRIAMWSGPRNVSTALMRSFDSRGDSIVCDEPLYAHYLRETGLPHPVAAEIIAAHDADWTSVANWLTGPLPEGKSVFYQKHMAHHLLPNIEREWLVQLTHCFLIREPGQMLTSLIKVIPEPRLEDTGLPQQVALFREEAERAGATPPVIDSEDLLRDPAGMLRLLCSRLGLEFEDSMLAWEPGQRETDGVWAPSWYGNALDSTGFAPFTRKDAPVPPEFAELHAACDELYAELHALRLTVN
jgi:hypothetical protein